MAALKPNADALQKRAKPEMTALERTYEVQPGGAIDYTALGEEVNQRFPHILKRLAK